MGRGLLPRRYFGGRRVRQACSMTFAGNVPEGWVTN
jgi:hypothetical protein